MILPPLILKFLSVSAKGDLGTPSFPMIVIVGVISASLRLLSSSSAYPDKPLRGREELLGKYMTNSFSYSDIKQNCSEAPSLYKCAVVLLSY